MEMNWTPGMTLAAVERAVIEKAYRFYEENKTRTAQALGIAIRTLDNRLEEYAAQDIKLAETSTPSLNAEARDSQDSPYRTESDAQMAPQQSLPVSERKEVQKMSPGPNTKVHQNRSR